VCKTIASVLLSYPEYFPPNFRSNFLMGRSSYFFGPYAWAFYVHVISGPLTLIVGLVLISDSVRRKFPAWHRRLGRIQVVCVFFFVTPSGLWMARYATTGAVAAAGFATLAFATAFCVAKGWRAATQRRFERHRCWMRRGFVLLCSVVVLRTIGGLSEALEVEGTYPFAAWLSWLLPLLVLEFLGPNNQFQRPLRHRQLLVKHEEYPD